jgi:acylphosphatase
MKKCVHIRVYGQVQHKGFRFSAMQVAYQRGIRGFIQNMKGGYLYIVAEGEEEQLTGFVEWCRKGPIWAKVEDVTVEDGEIENYTSFDMK